MRIKVQCTLPYPSALLSGSICCQNAPAHPMQCNHEISVASLCQLSISGFCGWGTCRAFAKVIEV